MKLSAHFSLEELTATEVRGIDNTCPKSLLPALTLTAEMLEKIRAALSADKGVDVPIIVTSGYRCAALNTRVGGQLKSDHVKAIAADFKAPAYGNPYEVCKFLSRHVDGLGIGQLIHEFGAWIHVSQSMPSKPVDRVITISSNGILAGVQKV